LIPVHLCLIAALASTLGVNGATKREPRIYYSIAIDSTDLSGFDVTMQIEGAPRSIRLAMAIHPEYNDRFWRYIRGLRATSVGKPVPLAFAVEAENAWRVQTRNGYAFVHYRIELPRENPAHRPVWHTALRADGASINPIDTFLYLPDFPHAQIDITLSVPRSWGDIVDLPSEHGLYSDDYKTWQVFHTDAVTLFDSPLLFGSQLRMWIFDIDGTPHTVAYWPLPNATPFDTAQFVDAITKVARQAASVFGKPPYSHYMFLLEDGAWGALEHMNSVTIGMPSTDLAKDPRVYLAELAHEFFHTWNLVRLYPEGRGTLSDRDPEHTTGLWLSEGVTMYYADALLHRAGFPERGMSRSDLLAEELESYYGTPGNMLISPELASARSVDTTGINGDYEVNYYVQGRLIGTALDLIIRDSTNGRRGLDDLMRALYSRFAMKAGFTSSDVERSASETCGCDLHRFFDDHVRNAHPLDFNRYLASIGFRMAVDTIPAADTAGARFPDTRVWASTPKKGGRMRIMIDDPSTVWGRAGLHTGDEIVAFNGAALDSFPDFRRVLRTIKLGDVVPVSIVRGQTPSLVNVRVTGYDRVRVRMVDAPEVTVAQRERRRHWLIASPTG
jgi:predicted metalloprotease with PDZ domain